MDILQLVFLNQRHDFAFVAKFRTISKNCKNFAAEWTIEFTCPIGPIEQLYIMQFKNLRKIKNAYYITDEMLQHFKYLTYLDIEENDDITGEGIKYLINLRTLNANSTLITDEALKNLQLHELKINFNENITDAGIAHLPLRKLHAKCTNITNVAIAKMNLNTLDASFNSSITDEVVMKLELSCLYAANNINITNKSLSKCLRKLDCSYDCTITNEGINGLTNLEVLIVNYNNKITNDAIKNLQLKRLYACSTLGIDDEGIAHMTNLQHLAISHNSNVTDKSVIKLTSLKTLYASGNSNVTDESVKHLTNLQKLWIQGTSGVTDVGIRSLKLRYLNSAHNKNVTITTC